jgi:hypothetical protein
MSRLTTPSHRVRRLPIGTLASEIWASAHLPIGVRSEPTPPPCPGFDVAPPAPGGLSADGPARFGQQPAVPPVVDRVSLDTESFADLDKSNRRMFRVLVRHGRRGQLRVGKGMLSGASPKDCCVPAPIGRIPWRVTRLTSRTESLGEDTLPRLQSRAEPGTPAVPRLGPYPGSSGWLSINLSRHI